MSTVLTELGRCSLPRREQGMVAMESLAPGVQLQDTPEHPVRLCFFMSPKSFPNEQLERDPEVNDVPLSLAYTSLTHSVSAVLEGFDLHGYVTAALSYSCARVQWHLPKIMSTQTQNRPLFDVGSPQKWVARTRLYRVARAPSSTGVP